MSKQKTPIEELIEKLEVQANKQRHETVNETLKAIIPFVKLFLLKEKEAIELAYFEGKDDGMYGTIKDMEITPNQYYTDKYGK